jgi:hypothetical protein
MTDSARARASETSAPDPRPRTVDAAFWLCIGAAVLAVLGLAATLSNLDTLRARVLRQPDAQGHILPPNIAEGVFVTGVVIGVVSGVLFAVGYVLVGILLRRGVSWSRWGIGVLAVLSISGIFNGVPSFLEFACMVAATALAFLEPSTEWLLSIRRWRKPKRI